MQNQNVHKLYLFLIVFVTKLSIGSAIFKCEYVNLTVYCDQHVSINILFEKKRIL